MLMPHQRTFYQRINSHISDRNSWLNSLAEAVIGKKLNSFRDEDERKLYDKLPEILNELDNHVDFSSVNIDQEKEHALKIEITDLSGGKVPRIVRLPKNRETEVENAKHSIISHLTSDKELNIYILTKILKEHISNE